jgi:threonine 3-dehydrogenase
MARLITGGAGFLGAELAHLLVGRGEEVVLFVRNVRKERIGDLLDRAKVIQGDLGNWSQVLNAFKDNHITHVYHTGALLARDSEANPWSAFQTNVIGMYNVLEASRLHSVERILYTSSIGTFFGEEIPSELTDNTLQRPREMYGLTKLFGELLGSYYRIKFNLDFRSLRFAMVKGLSATTTKYWDAEMLEHAIAGKPYECPVSKESRAPWIYYKDATLAVNMLMEAPRENIKMQNYNVSGITSPVSASDMEKAIKRTIPNAIISYSTNPQPPSFQSVIERIDDSYARQEWGWKPRYATVDQMVSDMISEITTRQK